MTAGRPLVRSRLAFLPAVYDASAVGRDGYRRSLPRRPSPRTAVRNIGPSRTTLYGFAVRVFPVSPARGYLGAAEGSLPPQPHDLYLRGTGGGWSTAAPSVRRRSGPAIGGGPLRRSAGIRAPLPRAFHRDVRPGHCRDARSFLQPHPRTRRTVGGAHRSSHLTAIRLALPPLPVRHTPGVTARTRRCLYDLVRRCATAFYRCLAWVFLNRLRSPVSAVLGGREKRS